MNKIEFKLNNNKKRKRYLVTYTSNGKTLEWASALHCAEALGIKVSRIYKAVNSFIGLGTKYNERGIVRRHFIVDGYKLFISIQNEDYATYKPTINREH